MGPGFLEKDVEEAALTLFAGLGWSVARAMHETFGKSGTLGRETTGEAILRKWLRPALVRLNPGVPADALDQALEQIERDRSAMSLVAANRDAYGLLRNGAKVRIPRGDHVEDVTVRVIDWDEPENNHFLVVQQLRAQGEIYGCRADLVGFVNGLPLVFIELKGIHNNVEKAYKENLRHYLSAVPHLFWFNAVILLSNGVDSRAGSASPSSPREARRPPRSSP